MAVGSLASFRSNAIVAAKRFPNFVAASAMLAGSTFLPLPAFAKDQITGMPSECATIVDRNARLACGTKVYNNRTAAADREITKNKKVSEAGLATKSCADGVNREIEAAIKAGPLSPDQVSSFKGRLLACNKS